MAAVLAWRGAPTHFRAPRHPAAPQAGALGPAPAAPEPAFLLAHATELHLTDVQEETIAAIDRRYQDDTAPLRKTLDRSAAAFRGVMEQTKGKGMTLPEIQQRAAETSELSRSLAMARASAWADASRSLTPEQREQAELLWGRRMRRR